MSIISNRAPAEDEGPLEGWEQQATPTTNPTVLACEARRCHVCSRGRPAFGFGPPLTKSGQELWACGLHRAEVERMLRERNQMSAVGGQLPLL